MQSRSLPPSLLLFSNRLSRTGMTSLTLSLSLCLALLLALYRKQRWWLEKGREKKARYRTFNKAEEHKQNMSQKQGKEKEARMRNGEKIDLWGKEISDGGEEENGRAVIAPPIIPLHFSWTFSEEERKKKTSLPDLLLLIKALPMCLSPPCNVSLPIPIPHFLSSSSNRNNIYTCI